MVDERLTKQQSYLRRHFHRKVRYEGFRMISRAFGWIINRLNIALVKRNCRLFVKRAGFLRAPSTGDWNCSQCNEHLDEIQSEKIVHTAAGETFKWPSLVATMCVRCAWVADGESKMPIWKWLHSRGKGGASREFLLKNEQAGLRIRLAEIERELRPRETLHFDDKKFRDMVKRVKKSPAA